MTAEPAPAADPARRLTLTGAQVRATRTLLGWSGTKLVEAAGVSQSTIFNMERNDARLSDWTHRTIRQALGAAAVAVD